MTNRILRGASITAAGQAVALALQIAGDIVLARLLGPAIFGKYLAIFVFVGFAMQFRDFGLSAATIQSRTMTGQQASNLHWMNVFFGGCLTLVFAALSPLFATYYGSGEYTLYALGMSMCFVIGAVGAQYQAHLAKAHAFPAIAAANILGLVAFYASAIPLGLGGAGAWSLVVGFVIRGAVQSLVLRVACKWRPLPFARGAGTVVHLRFGGHVAAFDVINYVSRNIDNVIVGRMFGEQALGIYNRAYQVMLLPIAQLRGPLVSAGLPALSDNQFDTERHSRQFLWVVRALAALALPMAAFLGIHAPLIIEVVLGEAWSASAPLVRALAPAAIFQPTCGLLGLYLLSRGRSATYLRWGAMHAGATVLSIVLAAPHGTYFMSLAYSACQAALFVPSAIFCLRESPLPPMLFLSAHLGAAMNTIASTLPMLLVPMLIDIASWPPPAQLACHVTTFGLAYAMLTWRSREDLRRHA